MAVFFGTFFSGYLSSQQIALKSNVLYDITSTLNLGTEIRCNDKYSACLSINYNPWTFSENKKIKHFGIQPEYRRWFDETFVGAYMGLQAHYAQFNWGGVFTDSRYQGNLAGIGISAGYQWMLSPLWNLEVGGAFGYAYLNYDKFGAEWGAAWIKKEHKNYWGLTQVGVSFVYFIQ